MQITKIYIPVMMAGLLITQANMNTMPHKNEQEHHKKAWYNTPSVLVPWILFAASVYFHGSSFSMGRESQYAHTAEYLRDCYSSDQGSHLKLDQVWKHQGTGEIVRDAKEINHDGQWSEVYVLPMAFISQVMNAMQPGYWQ